MGRGGLIDGLLDRSRRPAGSRARRSGLRPAGRQAQAGATLDLRIIATTDLHAHVMAHDYAADRSVPGIGLALAARAIARARDEARNALVFDNGDFLTGNPLGEMLATGAGQGADHPMIAAMNATGYDAVALGNHEFNHGLPFLIRALTQARFPVVAANLTALGDGIPPRWPVPPFVLLDRQMRDRSERWQALRIGVIGFLPPQAVQWDARHLQGRVTARDIVPAAAEIVPHLQAAGADVIVALCHSGIGAVDPVDGMENAAVPLAAVPGIDVLIMGHSHLVFPGPDFAGQAGVDPVAGTIAGKPAVMAGANGSHLGVIDLVLTRSEGRWQVDRHAVAARRVGPAHRAGHARGDRAVIAAAAAGHAATLAHLREPVGRSSVALHTHFALVAPSAAVRLIAAAQHEAVVRALRDTPHAHLPVLSAAAPFRAGGRGGPAHYTDIPAGPLSRRSLADLCPYPNTMAAIRMPGRALLDWLERTAAAFAHVAPGARDAPLLTPGFAPYNFDTLHGLSYRIALDAPSRHDRDGRVLDPDACRVRHVRLAGAPLDPETDVIVAANSYRASGGGGYAAALAGCVVWEGSDLIRDVLAAHVVSGPQDDGGPAADWGFVPMPGTTVLFPAPPAASAHAGAVFGGRIEPAGDGADGFSLFRLHL
ncbi:MAG: bifunctional 2',3'-cyclic-nucleotide 2'-phosphodiesterase/3'-nucleotidase [Rhodobacteraceae bacterium]|jgi:2',3'-cyclic-nucleotide 2'-phosphodiesterase/3'-nucleotidase|nr:bifunctional 2',3'-cyclic-nucleotide 2'-phosphodiesterase/3'-nucleotidase [Paracoccaceae bacterium]